MRYRLRTLLIVLALGPTVLWIGWGKYQAWKAEQDRQAAMKEPLPIVTSKKEVKKIKTAIGGLSSVPRDTE
jgi:hypothetical protein